MKLTLAMTLAVTGVVGVALPASADDQTTASAQLTVTPNQNDATKGGYVVGIDGAKTYINAACKSTLIDAGAVIAERPWSELRGIADVPRSERADCDAMVSWFDQAGAALGEAPDPDTGSSDTPAADESSPASDAAAESFHVMWYRTAGTADPVKGGFVVSHGQFRTWVSPDCKADLLDAGMMTVDSTWTNVRQIEKKANSCDDLMQILTNGDEHGGPDGHQEPAVEHSEPGDEHDAPGHEAPGDDVPGHDSPGHDGHTAPAQWLEAADEHATYDDREVPEPYQLFDPENHPHRTWGDSRIGFLVECDSVKFEQVDPIVSPGRASHHLHEFFGNPNVTSMSTTQSLADTPTSDIKCTDVNDKSAYWSPAVFQDGKRVAADNFKAYYKSTTADTVPMPFGLRMIAGDMASTGDQGGKVGWFEVQRTNDLTPVSQLTTTRRATEMITRPNDDTNIVLRMNYPNCWDGVHLDSPDHQSHVAYFNERTRTCPATHPVKIPQLVTFARYDVDGGDGFELASGPWYTYHQDFWNAWSPAQMEALNEECILEQMNCRVRPSPALMRLGQFEQIIPG